MNSNITIIPSDYMVSIDGEALHLDFTIDPSIHAIQWKNGAGEIEYVDASKQNLKLKGSADYNKYIKSYVELWNDEKERKEVEANKPPSLEEAKKQARQELKEYRKQIEYGGFMVNGQRWDSEQKDELRLNSVGKIFEAGLPEYPGWKIADGVYITLTPGILQQATLAFMQHTGAAFALEAAKLNQINALESSEAVLAWLENEMKVGWGQAELEPEVNPNA